LQTVSCPSPKQPTTCESFWKQRRLLVTGLGILWFGILTVLLFDSVRSALEIGADEHFELSKGLLWANGYKLYNQVWNDQPPLHTVMLGQLFRLFGASIALARGFAVCFGILLFAGNFHLVKNRFGSLAAWITTACLLAAPCVLVLSVSVMLEVPAMAGGLLALWPLHRWSSNYRLNQLGLVGSAVILAGALQIKFTACIFVPALCLEIVLLTRERFPSGWTKKAISNLLIWGASVVACLLVLGVLLGSGYSQAWTSHFSQQTLQSSEARQFKFSFDLLLGHTEALLGTALGLCVAVFRREWRPCAFPCALLGTVGIVHTIYYPWWWYYYLHFAIPLAWISGYGVSRLIRIAVNTFSNRLLNSLLGTFCKLAVVTGLVGAMVIKGGGRLVSEIERLRDLPRVEKNQMISKMKEFACVTRWVYTPSTIYAFHAGLIVPPELAILVKKRFWSGNITKENITSIVERYQPEQILLRDGESLAPADLFIAANYILVYRSDGLNLYVSKRLAAEQRFLCAPPKVFICAIAHTAAMKPNARSGLHAGFASWFYVEAQRSSASQSDRSARWSRFVSCPFCEAPQLSDA
jgi:hypothetical protein